LYITSSDVVEVIKQMRGFEGEIDALFKKRGYSFRNNTGRRNALLSVAQEVEVAKVLRKKYKKVIEDGSPGKPDIYIEDIKKELECKLTSGSRSGGSVVYALQTDWDTICAKKKLDYLYILVDKDFSNYCVLFFKDLTSDDFFPPAPGARGKSRMNKTKAMLKATCLLGSFTLNNTRHIDKVKCDFDVENIYHIKKLRSLTERIKETSSEATKRLEYLMGVKERETTRHRKKIKNLSDRFKYWKDAPSNYKFSMMSVS